MRRHWPLFPTALSLLFVLAAPSYSDDAPPPQGALYLGQGRMLEAAAPRQLSLNAHVTQFDYQPGSLEIAYIGTDRGSNTVTQSVRLVGVRYGKTVTLMTNTVSTDSSAMLEEGEAYSVGLAGWSADARYLLIRRDVMHYSQDRVESNLDGEYTCVDVGADPIRSIPIPLPDLPVAKDAPFLLGVYWWSPSKQRILFAAQGIAHENGASHALDAYCVVYNPADRKLTPVPLADKMIARGWLDEDHILADDCPALHSPQPSDTICYTSYDVANGTSTTVPAPAKTPPTFEVLDRSAHIPAVSPAAPGLTLEDSQPLLQDPQKVTTADARALWVRRTQGPKLMSAMPVGLTPGKEDPQAAWSPNGKQIAFVAHGDLFVSDLSERAATPVEKYRAGEHLTCQEESYLAAVSLRKIGLAILQFVQDNDENFPTAQEQPDKVAPYLPPDVLLSVGGHPFVYHAPLDLALAKIDSPSTFVLGTIDLPCAGGTQTLFADGHVHWVPKQGTGTDSANN